MSNAGFWSPAFRLPGTLQCLGATVAALVLGPGPAAEAVGHHEHEEDDHRARVDDELDGRQEVRVEPDKEPATGAR